jgi:hypothetical protein
MKSYKAFINENIQKDNIQNNVDVKLSYEIKTFNIELSQNKLATFDKLIKNIKRYSKQIGLPTPVIKDLPTKKYYILTSLSLDYDLNRKTSFYKETITDDDKKITDLQIEYKNKSPKTNFQIISTEVYPKTIEIVAEIKPQDEWVILGVIDHIDGIIKAAPNQQIPFDLIPADLHNSCTCDHCNTERTRNKTVYIKNLKDSKTIRVGGSCIKYYLGYKYEHILNYLSDLQLFVTSFNNMSNDIYDEFEGVYSNGSRYIQTQVDVKDCVKYFSWYVKKHGYISKSSAEKINTEKQEKSFGGDIEPKMVSSTGNIVSNTLSFVNSPPSRTKEAYDSWMEEVIKVTDIISKENDDFYNKLVPFVETEYKTNNFLFNVHNFINNGVVDFKYISYIIGACSMFQGKISYEDFKNKSKEEQKESNWVGTVGEKVKLENLKIVHVSGFEGQWGWTSIFKLEDKDGNQFTRFGDIPDKFLVSGTEVVVDSVVSFTAEIKKHDTYNDKKQTVLGRLSKI